MRTRRKNTKKRTIVKPTLLFSFLIVTVIALVSLYLHLFSQTNWKLQEVTEGEALYLSQNEQFELEFGNKKKSGVPQVTYKLDEDHSGQAVSFKLEKIGESFNKEEAKTTHKLKDDGESLLYEDVIKGVDIKYRVLKDKGVKEEIILKRPLEENKFEFQFDLHELEAKRDDMGIWRFYDGDREIFHISQPFMEDAAGRRSENVHIAIEAGRLTLTVDKNWTLSPDREYPITIGSTMQLTILTVHSHPQAGDEWTVEFETGGLADLKISPDDHATIEDIDFMSLKCGDTVMNPEILANDVIYYANWECSETADVTYLVNTAAPHRLKFELGGKKPMPTMPREVLHILLAE